MSISTARITGGLPSAAFLLPVENELALVEDRLATVLSSDTETASAISAHILGAGGKRLRPALVILSAYTCGGCDAQRLTDVAASAELIHMATLVHDDIIDNADSRRGRATANSMWGNQASVLTGDYMLAKAFLLLSMSADARMMQSVAQSAVTMCEGEIRQLEIRGDIRMLLDSYFEVIHDKTAAFMSVCCRVGAMLASVERDIEEALASYGRNIGMAFQITDDLLDLCGSTTVTGKPVGGDLREGKITLPVILTLQEASPADRTSVERIIIEGAANSEDIQFVSKLAQETGAVNDTRMAAANCITEAVRQLHTLPPSQYRDSLESLARSILTRDR